MITDIVANNVLPWLLAVSPIIWYICYYITGWEERKIESTATATLRVTYRMAMSTPSVWIFSVYLTALMTSVETWFTIKDIPFWEVVCYKAIIAVLLYPLSHGVVLYDVWRPRLTFTVYAMLPWSGSILFYKQHPMSIFTSPFLLIIVLYCSLRKHAKAPSREEGQVVIVKKKESSREKRQAIRVGGS